MRRLAGRHMLLVLDNFEQVLDAAPVVADLLQRASRLHVLVTSGWCCAFAASGSGGWTRWACSRPASAWRRWRRHLRCGCSSSGCAMSSPGFELTSANAAAVAELCRRLDGLPLALELAATWMRLLTPEQMLERLDERMERPAGLADLPDRQQTLTATLQWSYELLPQSAQQLLVRLSVFAAPFTAEAAEAVCGGMTPAQRKTSRRCLTTAWSAPPGVRTGNARSGCSR